MNRLSLPILRDQLILGRAAIDRGVLAERVPVADLEPRRLVVVFQILRSGADGGELENLVVAADRGRTVDHHVRADPGARADDDAGADDGVRANLHIRRELRRWDRSALWDE